MNNDKQDNAGSIAPPAYIYFVPLVVGIVLHFVFPLRFLPCGWLPVAIGLPLSVIGIILNGWSGTTMGKAGTARQLCSYGGGFSKHGWDLGTYESYSAKLVQQIKNLSVNFYLHHLPHFLIFNCYIILH